MVVAYYWQSNLRKFKAKSGLHSSGTARESYILRPCLKKQKPKRKKEKNLCEHDFPRLQDNMIPLNANTSVFFCSDNFIRFLYWSDTIGTEHVHIFNLAPFIGVHKALVCKYHHALHVTVWAREHVWAKRDILRVCQDLQATGTRAAATCAVNLASWLPSALYPSPGCTVCCEPCDSRRTSRLQGHLTRPCITMWLTSSQLYFTPC